MFAHLLLTAILGLTALPPLETIAIRAGALIDPASGTVAKSQVILVSNGKITAVGPSVTPPAGARQVDLSSAWVLPGLIDAHTHITMDMSNLDDIMLGSAYLRESSARRALRGLWNAEAILNVGFTTVRDVGNDANYAAVDIRRALANGWFIGPTVLTTGKIITPFGGQSQRVSPEQGPLWLFEYIDADTVDEIRKAVRQNIYYGAQAIKMVADNSAFYYTRDEIAAAVAEAHAAGLPVSVHVGGGEAARNVILGGADSIEHGFQLSDELLQLMKEKGTALVSTDFPEDHLKLMNMNEETDGMTLGRRIVDRLRRAHAIGVKLVFGTDCVLERPDRRKADLMLDYYDVWKSAEIPSAAALKALTVNAAELLRIQKVRGTIAPGMAADIVAVPSNPLDDLAVLKKVIFVMKAGRVVKQSQ